MNKKTSYLLGGISTLLFLLLTLWVRMGHIHSGLSIDSGIQSFAYHLQQSAGLTSFFTYFTNLFGHTGGFITAAFFALLLFFVLREKIGAIWFGLLTVISTVVNTVIKDLVGRVRPDTHRIAAFAHESGQSFVSGHSLFATILFGALLLIFWEQMPKTSSKIVLGILALLLTLLVMFSRIYVGVHYPSDTIGGLLEGLAFLMFSYPTFVIFNKKKYRLKILN